MKQPYTIVKLGQYSNSQNGWVVSALGISLCVSGGVEGTI